MSSRKRTCKTPKGADYEYWSARPCNKNGGTLSPRGGKHHQRRTHRAERRQGRAEREVLADCATTLESYARHHAERGPEHAHKVTRNAELAARCRAALAAKE